MRRRLTAALCCMVMAAFPAGAEPISLADAVRRALLVSPDIESAEAGVQEANANLDQARGERGISIGAQAQLGVAETDFTTASISQVPRQVALQAELPLYTSGRLAASEEAARQGLQSAGHLRSGTGQSVSLETLEAYTALWLAGQAVSISQDEVEALRLRGEEAQRRLEQGLATRTDTALADSRLASASAKLAGEKAGLAAAELRFERLTGLAGAAPLDPATVAFALPPSLEQATSTALSNNPALAAARAQADAARAQEARTRGAFGPEVSLKARASTGEDIYFFFEDQISDIGAFVTVEVPLFTNGVRPAAIDRAGAGRRAAEAAARKQEQALRENVGALWYRVLAQEQTLVASRRAEQAAGLAVEGARREHALDLRTLADLLDAENEYSRAAISHRIAEVDLLLAQARLLTLMSTLQAQILEAGQ